MTPLALLGVFLRFGGVREGWVGEGPGAGMSFAGLESQNTKRVVPHTKHKTQNTLISEVTQ